MAVERIRHGTAASTCMTGVRVSTRVGTARSVVLPSPSSPSMPLPRPKRCRRVARRRRCRSPRLSRQRAPARGPVWAGRRTRAGCGFPAPQSCHRPTPLRCRHAGARRRCQHRLLSPSRRLDLGSPPVRPPVDTVDCRAQRIVMPRSAGYLSCPMLVSPQAHTVPPRRNAYPFPSPAAMAITPDSCWTRPGTASGRGPAPPSCPKPSSPHAQTVPSRVRAYADHTRRRRSPLPLRERRIRCGLCRREKRRRRSS